MAGARILLLALLLGAGCVGEPAGPTGVERCAPPPPRPAGLVLAGSGSNLPLVRRIAERYRQHHPAARITIPQSIGTSGAVRALLDGAIDVGLASRSLKAGERARGLVETRLARTRVVFAVHPSVAVRRASAAELVAIYRGERTRWPDGTPIVPLLREPGDSARVILARSLPALDAAIEEAFHARRFRACFTDAEMQRLLAALPGALGFLDEGILRLEGGGLRALALSDATLPALKPLSFVTRGTPRGEAERFLLFARSPEIAALLAAGGYLP